MSTWETIDRALHKTYAKTHGYFWLPCPFPGCGRMFGGHECGSYTIRDKDQPSLGSMTCRAHDQFAQEMFNIRMPGASWWSSDGRLSYWGDPETDIRHHQQVSEFRQREAQNGTDKQ